MRELLEPQATERSGNEAARLAIAIGPEGGWTEAEFAAAGAEGFRDGALGANILRTETAVCAALAAVQYAFGASRPAPTPDYSEWSTPSQNTPVRSTQFPADRPSMIRVNPSKLRAGKHSPHPKEKA